MSKAGRWLWVTPAGGNRYRVKVRASLSRDWDLYNLSFRLYLNLDSQLVPESKCMDVMVCLFLQN